MGTDVDRTYTGLRTADVPDTFWTKHNRAMDAGRIPEGDQTHVCQVCGRSDLSPETGAQVAIVGGGGLFLHPDDLTEAHITSDPGYMGMWSMGASCKRLAPARVRGPIR